MTNRPDQEMIDYWSSDAHMLTRIAHAIRANEEFEAVKLILIRQNQADASTAAMAAWMLGPIKGQAMIADYIQQHDFDLEPNSEKAEPKAQPVKHKARRIAVGTYLYRLHTIRRRGPFFDKRGIWDITKDGESRPRDSAASLRDAKALIDQWKGPQP